MDSNREWRELSGDLKMFGVWIASSLIDSAFIAAWAYLQFIAKNIISDLELTEIDRWLLIIFQILFAVSTLAPILIYIYVDIRVMILRAKRRINQELTLGRGNE